MVIGQSENCKILYSDFYGHYILLVRKPGLSGNSVPYHFDTKEAAEEAMEQHSNHKKMWWED